MYKIIGADQREYGPVTAEQLRQWIAEGRMNGQTLAQAEGATEWKPLSAFPEFAEALRAQLGQSPLVGSSPPPTNTGAWTAQILAREPVVEVGRCLSLSWSLLTANFGLLFGATFVVWLISLCESVPLFGPLVYRIFAGVFYGGLCLVFLKRIRGESAAISDVLAGFRLNFAQLVLAGFISYLLGYIGLLFCIVPGIYLLVAWIFSVPLVADKRLEFWSAMELSRKAVTRVWFEVFGLMVLAFLPVILMNIFIGTKISLMAFSVLKDVLASGPPDYERIMQVMTPVSRAGVLFGFIARFVLLLNLPFAVGALMYAYENLFGARTTTTA
jgi:hypothetical protein